MTKYTITAPETRFNGEFAGLVFRAGKADAETPADQAAVIYCRRRGYGVVAVDTDGELLPERQQPDADTPDPDAVADDGLDVVVDEPTRPADYASKADWVNYAVAKGAVREDAEAATKNELVQLYG
jgi:hypothetical protein